MLRSPVSAGCSVTDSALGSVATPTGTSAACGTSGSGASGEATPACKLPSGIVVVLSECSRALRDATDWDPGKFAAVSKCAAAACPAGFDPTTASAAATPGRRTGRSTASTPAREAAAPELSPESTLVLAVPSTGFASAASVLLGAADRRPDLRTAACALRRQCATRINSTINRLRVRRCCADRND